MSWPDRTRLCVSCRRTLAADESCHDAVALAVVEQRNALVRAVWGTTNLDHLPRRLDGDSLLTKLLTGTGLGALVAAGILGRAHLLLPALALVSVGLVAFTPVLLSAYRKRYEIGTKRSARPKDVAPIGAARAAMALPSARALRGVIAKGALLPAPITGEPCVAFAITLRSAASDERPVLLRDSRTSGFTIEADDGRCLSIHPGTIELGAEGELVDPFRARLHLATVDPHYEADEGPDPFAFDEARMSVLRLGDRVDFYGPLTVAADPHARPTSYREAAGSILVPSGTPTVVKREEPSATA